MRTVFCQKYNQELEGLDYPPFPSAAGQKIFDTISKLAWTEWLAHQTMLINEQQLNSLHPNTRKYLSEERKKFFNNEDVTKVAGYVPIKSIGDE